MLTATNAAMMRTLLHSENLTYFEHVLVQITRDVVDPIIINLKHFSTVTISMKCSFSKAGPTVASHCDVNNCKENSNTGLFKLIVGVLTTCHTQYT